LIDKHGGEIMALLTNDRSGPSYLAVKMIIDKRLHPFMLFMRDPVASWDVSDEVNQELASLSEAILAELEEPESDWPQIDKAKVGWLKLYNPVCRGRNCHLLANYAGAIHHILGLVSFP
jgi:hypothetical protein